MDTALAVSGNIAQPERRHFVALTPEEVPAAQEGIAEWCKQKVVALGRELREQRQNLRHARAAKWKTTGWQSQVGRTKARMLYYVKIAAAVKAGYLIVPNFDVEVMAVRVNRLSPPETTATYRSSADVSEAKAQLLPPGTGRYVDDAQFVDNESYPEPDPKNPGHQRNVSLYRSAGYDVPDFPVLAVKPVVLAATERAMGLRIFDRIGVVTGRKKDPVVIGELLDPTDRYRHKRVSFFIAWWFDTASL